MADIKVAGKEALQTLWTRVYEEYPRLIDHEDATENSEPVLKIKLNKGYMNNGTPSVTGTTAETTITKGCIARLGFPSSKQDIIDLGIPGTDTNTTYTLSGTLASHKFTSTLTAGGSGSGTSKSELQFVAGTGITLTDDATGTTKKITIATNGEANQNAFSTITVGSTDINATAKSDTLTLVAGSNVTLTPDASNKKVTIAATDTTYSDFTGCTNSAAGVHGLVPAPAAATRGNILIGKGVWGVLKVSEVRSASNTQVSLGVYESSSATSSLYSDTATISAASDTLAGVMLPGEKTKLAGIAEGAEVNQNAFSRITVDSTNIDAEVESDTLTLEAGSHITLTPDATNDKVTIAAAWPTVPSAATENPKMDAASASVGTHSKYAREDHVHPTDTSRAPLKSPAFTGSPTVTSAPAAGDNSSKIPTTAWVQTELLSTMGDVAGALVYKGTVDAASDLLNTALKKGWYYVADGDFTLNGEQITPGDMIIVKTAGTYTTEANLDTATDIVGSNTTLLKQSDMTGWFTIPPATPSA